MLDSFLEGHRFNSCRWRKNGRKLFLDRATRHVCPCSKEVTRERQEKQTNIWLQQNVIAVREWHRRRRYGVEEECRQRKRVLPLLFCWTAAHLDHDCALICQDKDLCGIWGINFSQTVNPHTSHSHKFDNLQRCRIFQPRQGDVSVVPKFPCHVYVSDSGDFVNPLSSFLRHKPQTL